MQKNILFIQGGAVIVIDGDRNIVYTDLVEEITEEPRYDEALEVLRRK